ncbi:outer dense fiber protein 1-like [Apus apus]|uniref:outer dense fiber protein 1-like n=1 Tax=Apus apus TaxID=8895 RepID=UPI0021F83160|nr:outer dense fiber protein 1-like [Apus apus]XP_051497154.1 outer dense fiber protein 1-like [Apus apus]
MTFCYQTRCEDSCYSPCNYRRVCSYRTYDCSPCSSQSYDCSPCDYRGYGSLCSPRDCYPCYSSRLCYPYSSCYTRRYTYGSCYPC